MLAYKAALQCSKTCIEGHILKTVLDVNKLYGFYWDLLVSKLLSRGKNLSEAPAETGTSC